MHRTIPLLQIFRAPPAPDRLAPPRPQGLPLRDDADAETRYRNDPALVEACLHGDETAWADLVTRYARLIYSIPRRYGLCESDAEDVMQDVFIIVLRHLKSLRQRARLSAWLIAIAHRETIHWKQRARNADARCDHLQEFNDLPSLDTSLEQLEVQELLRQALARLTPAERQLIVLSLEEPSLSYDEIAVRAGMARGSIGPTRMRAFKKLEAMLKELGFDGYLRPHDESTFHSP